MLSWVGQRVLANLRSELFLHLQRLSLSYHDTHIVGVTVSRVMNDVATINELLSQGIITLVGDMLVLVGIMVIMLTMNPRLALLTFLVLPLMVLATIWFSRRARVAFRETRTRVARVVGDLAEDIAGVRVIQAFGQESSTQERFNQVNEANRDANINAMSLSFVFLPTIEFLGVLSTAIVLWFGGQAVGQGEVTLGVLVAFLSYVTRFFQPIQELSRMYTTMQAAMAGGEQVLKLLDTMPEVEDLPEAVEMLIWWRLITRADLRAQGKGDPGACFLPLPPRAARGSTRYWPEHRTRANGGPGGTHRGRKNIHRQFDRPLL